MELELHLAVSDALAVAAMPGTTSLPEAGALEADGDVIQQCAATDASPSGGDDLIQRREHSWVDPAKVRSHLPQSRTAGRNVAAWYGDLNPKKGLIKPDTLNSILQWELQTRC